MNHLSVIVSSTTVDLGETRRRVVEAVRRLPVVVVSMETFGASSSAPESVSVARVRESDVLVGLLGFRYGWVAPGARHSVTEMEYEAAQASGKIVLMYVPAQAYTLPASAGDSAQFAFIDRVQSEQHTCGTYHDSAELPATVVADLHRVLTGGPQGIIAYRKGIRELQNANYPGALYDLNWAVHFLPNDGAPAFLLALATLQGRLPRNVMRQDIQRAESLLETSIRISPSREAVALKGAIELDYYVEKGFGDAYADRAREHWLESRLYPANPENLALLLWLQPDLMMEYSLMFG
ncbi:MAG TPA: DUF4062 domain-containing protein [Ktedonobacterales bacterium]